jgi:dihydroxyacetone kinase
MVDALVPFADTLRSEIDRGAALTDGWATAALAARTAADGTATLLPKMGRARPHAEKSIGTVDAGAHSLALIADAVAGVLSTRNKEEQHG